MSCVVISFHDLSVSKIGQVVGLLPFIEVAAVSQAPLSKIESWLYAASYHHGGPVLCYRNLIGHTLARHVDKNDQHITIIHEEHNRKGNRLPTVVEVLWWLMRSLRLFVIVIIAAMVVLVIVVEVVLPAMSKPQTSTLRKNHDCFGWYCCR